MADYIVHKAVEVSKVKVQRRAVLEVPGVLESDYIAQPKYDGCNMLMFLYDSEGVRKVETLSRTNENVYSVRHIEAALMSLESMPPGVYLGECWCPDLEFPAISGLFRRKETDEDTCRLQFAIFDYLTLEEFTAGVSDLSYVARVARLPEVLSCIPQGQAPLWCAGSFGFLAETFPGTTAQDCCNKLVEAGGYDGLILRDPNGTWELNSPGTGGEIIKVKSKLSLDLRVIGYRPGKGKYTGKIGNLELALGEHTVGVGSGIKDSERDIEQFNAYWLGKIVEVEALGYTEDGSLREPRLKGIRHDKTVPDA